MSTRTIACQWEAQKARERTGHPSSYAEVKKIEVTSPFVLIPLGASWLAEGTAHLFKVAHLVFNILSYPAQEHDALFHLSTDYSVYVL